MPSIERIVLVVAVLAVLLTTTVGVAAAQPNESANPTADTANAVHIQIKNCVAGGGSPGECAGGLAQFVSSWAHTYNKPV